MGTDTNSNTNEKTLFAKRQIIRCVVRLVAVELFDISVGRNYGLRRISLLSELFDGTVEWRRKG